MRHDHPELDVTELREEVHGQELAIGLTQQPDWNERFCCDFCGATLWPHTPLQMDAIRNHDMDGLDRLFGPLEGWWIDSVRCPDCVGDRIHPPTDGWEEALVLCSTTERNGVLSVDTTDLSVLDYSPGPAGHYPPVIPLDTVSQMGLSFSRWSFLYRYLPLIEATVPDIGERQPLYQYCRDRLNEIERETTA
jgi:hypothetical protein